MAVVGRLRPLWPRVRQNLIAAWDTVFAAMTEAGWMEPVACLLSFDDRLTGSRYRGAAILLDVLVEGMAPASLALPHDAPLPAPGGEFCLTPQPAACLAVPAGAA